ncbi:MAG TPA: N(4)-(beta-N-acetylglucosaminyl)-L-asparaginase [Balneolaceae bacterium]|nr:N(4)-(beta-N-acetylglucosaminyl)-L-asparaginase [Balneolaceae bacterium]
MPSRKSFLKTLALGGGILPFSKFSSQKSAQKAQKPIVISTWNFGIPANKEAWKVLSQNGQAIDAVEQGVRKIEADPSIETVGYGGRPDRDGYVTLDACIMDHKNHCGSAVFLQDIMHPISVARKIKEDTKYIMLAGDGALEFALNHGFKRQNLLTPKAKKEWEEWRKKNNYHPQTPPISNKNHDTIGMIALDAHGQLSGACTTSGIAYKLHGRVADSGIIGAGMFVDGEVGGAAATGVGEEVIRTAGSSAVVENMRHGDDPKTACKKVVERIANLNYNKRSKSNIQEGFIAVNKDGEYGGYGMRAGFEFAVHDQSGNRLIKADHML